MMDFLVYSAKVSVLIVAFYTFYRLLLSRETFHRVNRIVLLSTALLSFLLPLCIITYHCIEEVESVAFQPTYTSGYFFPQLPPVPDSVAWWKIILEGIYLAGVAFVLCKILSILKFPFVSVILFFLLVVMVHSYLLYLIIVNMKDKFETKC